MLNVYAQSMMIATMQDAWSGEPRGQATRKRAGWTARLRRWVGQTTR